MVIKLACCNRYCVLFFAITACGIDFLFYLLKGFSDFKVSTLSFNSISSFLGIVNSSMSSFECWCSWSIRFLLLFLPRNCVVLTRLLELLLFWFLSPYSAVLLNCTVYRGIEVFKIDFWRSWLPPACFFYSSAFLRRIVDNWGSLNLVWDLWPRLLRR